MTFQRTCIQDFYILSLWSFFVSHWLSLCPNLQTGTKIWNCTDCGYKQKLRKDVLKHIERRHLNISLPCDICPAFLSSRVELRTHIRMKHTQNVGWNIILHLTLLFQLLFLGSGCNLLDPDSHGSTLILAGWIRILIWVGKNDTHINGKSEEMLFGNLDNGQWTSSRGFLWTERIISRRGVP